MPRVLFINQSKNYGSTGKIVEALGLLAESKGWDVALVHAARYDRPSMLKCIKAGSTFSENWHALMAQLFDRQGLQSSWTTKRVIRRIKAFKPDIIHLHNIHGYFLNYPKLFEFLHEAGIPVVWTMHDCWSFTGHCTYYDLVSCDKWKTGCHHCSNLNNYPQSVWLDRSEKNFAIKKRLFTQIQNLTLVPVSEWLGRETLQSFMRIYPINVIHNGIDTGIFRIKKSNLRMQLGLEGKYVILGVSSNGFTGRKGLSDFIKLSSSLSNEFQIIMIGMKDKELKIVPERIMGLTRTSNIEELVDYYNLADVFINLTYSDNFPTTNIEALACGTPVITYRTGGSPEAVDSKTGVVVEQGDIYGLIDAIKQIKAYPLLPDDCRQRAQKYFDKNKCFEKYLDLYDSLIIRGM